MLKLNERRIEVLGIPMHSLSMSESIEIILERIKSQIPTVHMVVNAAKLVDMQANHMLREAVVSSDIINIDGMGVVWAARMHGLKVPERVTGIDLFEELISRAEKDSLSVYLFGAEEQVLKESIKRLSREYPGLQIVGYQNGYFGNQESEVVEAIQRAKPDLLFVALGTPQKEEFLHRWKDSLNAKFAMGIGGTLDVYSGKVKRAPKWMQNHGLEWLYRMSQEPSRLWWRYTRTNLIFLWLCSKWLINPRKKL